MEVCFFGTYEKDYPSNRIIIKGLRKNGINVKECHVSLWEKYRNKHGKFLNPFSLMTLFARMVWAYFQLAWEYLAKHRRSDTVIIGYIGQLDIIFFKFLSMFAGKKPKLVFVPLVSLYDTAIVDRNQARKGGIFAKILFNVDKISFRLADIIILDTNEHIRYVSSLFNIDAAKFKRVWVGADNEVFYPVETNETSGKFTALFFGKFIPLHGIEHIIQAAKLLENDEINFKLIGNGQLYEKMRILSEKLDTNNIDFMSWVEYNELVKEINNADVILGIFGGSEKASRVIPNKVFQAIACRKAVVTGDTPAIRELFSDRKNIIMCKNGDPESIKESLLKLKCEKNLKDTVAVGGYALYQEQLLPEIIAGEL